MDKRPGTNSATLGNLKKRPKRQDLSDAWVEVGELHSCREIETIVFHHDRKQDPYESPYSTLREMAMFEELEIRQRGCKVMIWNLDAGPEPIHAVTYYVYGEFA